jgi:hypothetical protein
MVQEYIPNRNEVKIQTIWGKALVGAWQEGDTKSTQAPIWGYYDRAGNNVDGWRSEDRLTGKNPDKWLPKPEWWDKAIALAEKIAHGTDALRVDFMIRENGELLLSELEIWPESDWSSMEHVLEERLNAGYRQLNKKN